MRINDQLPKLNASGEWINSNGIKVEELLTEGKSTLIYFWSISCDICKMELPFVHRLRDRYGDNLTIISIHTPLIKDDKDLQRIKLEADNFKITEPLFADHDEILSQRFQVKYVPAYFIFNQEGELKHFQSGRNGGIRLLQRRLERVLKE
ncbi:TlpA disulfide reductase family protein [Oceanobacillus rekensis]|uniref:TlpA disulfide reductase family protein n=1 Tax=Oceanobacillus rekensis TaxID=937927 RepID=UPI000B43EABD|nr:TlpA disulfide reductase family protein [Oceanobacillus rekensis]